MTTTLSALFLVFVVASVVGLIVDYREARHIQRETDRLYNAEHRREVQRTGSAEHAKTCPICREKLTRAGG